MGTGPFNVDITSPFNVDITLAFDVDITSAFNVDLTPGLTRPDLTRYNVDWSLTCLTSLTYNV